MRTKPETRKVSMNLTVDDIETLRTLAECKSLTMTEVIRRGIAMEKFIHDELSKGSNFLIEEPDKTIRMLVIR